jgi:hypothetical protein
MMLWSKEEMRRGFLYGHRKESGHLEDEDIDGSKMMQ